MRLRETYGITLAEYDRILTVQGGVCAICGRKPRYNLDVDHDHKTGVVRGLLCKLCNRRLLPAARDETIVLKRAYDYLHYRPAERALGRRVVVPTAGSEA